MRLLHDDVDNLYVWVADDDPYVDLSPVFDTYKEATEWYEAMKSNVWGGKDIDEDEEEEEYL
jgi:hypothetical protein